MRSRSGVRHKSLPARPNFICPAGTSTVSFSSATATTSRGELGDHERARSLTLGLQPGKARTTDEEAVGALRDSAFGPELAPPRKDAIII